MKKHSFIVGTILLLITCSYSETIDERWKSPERWREKIELGLSEREVVAALGKPLYVHRSSEETVMCYQLTTPQENSRGSEKQKTFGFPKYGVVRLTAAIKEEKPQIKAIQGTQKERDDLLAQRKIDIENAIAKRKGEYYARSDSRKMEKETKDKDELIVPVHKVDSWTEPDWNAKDNRSAFFLPPDAKKEKLEKWQDTMTWKRLRLNLTEEYVIKMFGDPSRLNRGVQSASKTEQSTVNDRSLRDGEWLLYGDEIYGGILRFRYDHGVSKYLLAYWSEPYWPIIFKQDKETKNKPVSVELETVKKEK